MNYIRKATALFAAFLLLGSFALSACGKDADDSSSSPASSELPHTEHSWELTTVVNAATCTEKGSGTYTCVCGETKTDEIPIDPSRHDYQWTCDKQPTCTENGLKSAVCKRDASHTQTGVPIEKRGHFYENGVCSLCEDEYEIPATPADVTYVNPYDKDSGIEGDGSVIEGEINPYRILGEGYYTFSIESESNGKYGGTWICLSVPESGQYALYTTDNNPARVKISNCAGSLYYVSVDDCKEARTLDDGNAISTVNCSNAYWSAQWTTFFRLEGNLGDEVNVRIARIADPAWESENIYEKVKPQQLNGKKAENGGENEELQAVPYNSEYYYDETAGYYRTGTKENPGEMIYAAITKKSERLFQDISFTQVLDEGGRLTLHYATDADGNNVLRDYAEFIDKDYSSDENCYEYYVNSDGVYPVTQELYEFLNLYVKANRPIDIPDSIWNDSATRTTQAWLAACYYYTKAEIGSEERPQEIVQSGDFTVNTRLYDYVYCKVNLQSAETNVEYCTLSWSETTGLVIKLGDEPPIRTSDGVTSVTIKNGSIFMIKADDEQKKELTLTLSAAENP